MKRLHYFLLACFLITGSIVSAQSPEVIYSASSLPKDAGWQELKLDNTVSDAAAVVTQEVGSGVLKIKSTNAADQFSQLGWYKTGLGLDLSTGYTIEIKAKINDASKYGAFNIQGYDNQGKGFRLGIYNSYLGVNTDPLAATLVVKNGLTNNDNAFHIYRLVVPSSGLVTVYRDEVEIGKFPLSAFYFDNIIENGGFEDGGDDLDDESFFPDFKTASLMYRTDEAKEKRTGKYGFVMNNEGYPEEVGYDDREAARTREIAVKPDTKYDISITRRRIAVEPDWAWRDMGAFYDFQQGTQNKVDDRNDNALFAGCNDAFWQVHNQTITTPAETDARVAKSLRFEFPSWFRDAKNLAITAFDNFIFREKTDLVVGPTTVAHMSDPVFPAGYVNLIQNGDFEDWTINNDGSAYDWALSFEDDPEDPENNDKRNSNLPAAQNDLWKGPVRIQRNDKPDDAVSCDGNTGWAHSGTSSLRFSTQHQRGNLYGFEFEEGQGGSRNLDFTMELQAGKTYRFNFWHRAPKWRDGGWLKVRVGDNAIWGQDMNGDDRDACHGAPRSNVWANADMTFTTTAENKTLHLYSENHGDWWNIYLDDLVLYEVTGAVDPQIAGKTNLIANGDFEDDTINNDGSAYEWALASTPAQGGDNFPVAYNDQWGTYVRLQDQQKGEDTGLQWAHSGTKSLRFSFLDDWGRAREFEDLPEEELPNAYRLNMNFQKELQPNKTYTFVFWIKTANYGDRGKFVIANGDIRVWEEDLTAKYINWTRQSITFSTTGANHTLRMFTEFGGWFNFYLDDLFLYEEATYVPFESDGDSYLFFGKSTGTQSTDVEIEYVSVDNTGAFAPNTGINDVNTDKANTLKVRSTDGRLVISTFAPATVQIYNVAGVRVAELNVKESASIALPQGVYLVKSGSGVVKVINK